MIKLKRNYLIAVNSKGHLYAYEEQEIELLEFFLNTSKPIVSVDASIYNLYQDYFKEYPKQFVARGNVIVKQKDKRSLHVVIAKTKKDLDKYNETLICGNTEKYWRQMGESFGYPKTAIDYFINENLSCSRYLINYYGLKFVCKKEDLPIIKEELYIMYKLPVNKLKIK